MVDTPDFYIDITFKKILDWQPDFSIIAGDFNIALDQTKDTKNYLHVNNPNARIALKEQIEQNNLIDMIHIFLTLLAGCFLILK